MLETISSKLGFARRTNESRCWPLIIDSGEKNARRWFWSWRCGIALALVALSSVAIIASISRAMLKNESVNGSERHGATWPDPLSTDEMSREASSESVRFVERDEWIAQEPSQEPRHLEETPAPYVIISHTATRPCSNRSECILRVRLIQTYHIESRGWSDIAYNFLIGGDGLAYVARGWDLQGAHARGWNGRSIGISFVGLFNEISPPERQLRAAVRVIERGLELGKISWNYTLLGHRQVADTLSPGQKIFDIMKKSHHWLNVSLHRQ